MEQENKTAEQAEAQKPEDVKPEELLKRLTEAMSQTGNPEMAQNIQVLTLWTANIQMQNNELKQQMEAMQSEIAYLKQSPVKRAFQTAVTAAKNGIHEAGEAIQNALNAVTNWAKNALNAVKDGGVAFVDAVVSIAHIKPLMELAQKGVKAAKSAVHNAVERGEKVGFELREAGRALHNAAKAAKGQELDSNPANTEGKFQAFVLAPLRGAEIALDAMSKGTQNTVNALGKLEQAGRESRGRIMDRCPSIIKQLKEGREQAAARPLPPPDRARRTAEAAL